MSLCKKHGKERNVIVKSQPSKKGGAVFEYVGCEDCAAAKGSTVTKPLVVAKPPEAQPVAEKKGANLGHRFGFKL